MLLYLSTPPRAPANYKRIFELSSNIRYNIISRKDQLPLYLSTPPRVPVNYKEYMNCKAILGQMSRKDQMLLYLRTPQSPGKYKRVYKLSSNIRSNV